MNWYTPGLSGREVTIAFKSGTFDIFGEYSAKIVNGNLNGSYAVMVLSGGNLDEEGLLKDRSSRQ
jgi:hypothetical protein